METGADGRVSRGSNPTPRLSYGSSTANSWFAPSAPPPPPPPCRCCLNECPCPSMPVLLALLAVCCLFPARPLKLSQGFLMKRRETGNWQRRWCVLTERDMEYYHSRQVRARLDDFIYTNAINIALCFIFIHCVKVSLYYVLSTKLQQCLSLKLCLSLKSLPTYSNECCPLCVHT